VRGLDDRFGSRAGRHSLGCRFDQYISNGRLRSSGLRGLFDGLRGGHRLTSGALGGRPSALLLCASAAHLLDAGHDGARRFWRFDPFQPLFQDALDAPLRLLDVRRLAHSNYPFARSDPVRPFAW
jgi:hypothetical protein